MTKHRFQNSLDKLAGKPGVFYLKNYDNKTLYVGITGNIKNEIKKIYSEGNSIAERFREQLFDVEVLTGEDLVKTYAQAIRRLKPIYNISLADQPLYPFLKITREEYPRMLATRKIEDDDARYFGAFLPSTVVRFWIEFINRSFRLRTCQILIDGNFPAPCTQFYVKRCVAPCVESLCDKASYLEMVKLVQLFLSGEKDILNQIFIEKIDAEAQNLEFEKAAVWRDLLQKTNEVFASKKWWLKLDDVVDTFEVEQKDDRVFVYLITQRGRKTLGKKVFVFETYFEESEILVQTLWQFYEFHEPKEIRVPFNFPNRKLLIETLSRRARRDVKITIVKDKNQRKTSQAALKRAKFDFDFRSIKPLVKFDEISLQLQNIFHLPQRPLKIECFDAAHISGNDFTVGKTVWEKGKFIIEENEFWLLDEKNELECLKRAIEMRFLEKKSSFPDLLLIDGGKSQLAAALHAISFLKEREFIIICAVKPPQRHAGISHFITEKGKVINFSNESEGLRILLQLRDEAHLLTNRVHRLRRENSHFYELAKLLPSINESRRRELLQKFGSLRAIAAASKDELENLLDFSEAEIVIQDLRANQGNPIFAETKPLIVPIRYDDPNGDARDLQPLNYTKI